MVTLAEAKDHLRVSHDSEDAGVAMMIAAALDHMRSIDVDVTVDPLPPALHHAALMLVAHFYENREAVGEPVQAVPLGFERLVSPYRSWAI